MLCNAWNAFDGQWTWLHAMQFRLYNYLFYYVPSNTRGFRDPYRLYGTVVWSVGRLLSTVVRLEYINKIWFDYSHDSTEWHQQTIKQMQQIYKQIGFRKLSPHFFCCCCHNSIECYWIGICVEWRNGVCYSHVWLLTQLFESKMNTLISTMISNQQIYTL